nr:hypothetical protein [Nanoarchaeum sp.]
MEKNEVVLFFVLFVLFFSIASPIFFYLNSYEYLSSEDVTSSATAAVNLSVIPTCGDSLCEIGEDCFTCSFDCGECICGDTFCEGNETCNNCPIDCGNCTDIGGGTGTGGGGGGGGSAALDIFFEFNPKILEVRLLQEKSTSEQISIKNLGRKDISVILSVSGVENLLRLDSQILLLKRKEIKYFNAIISTSEQTKSGVYFGEIIGRVDSFEETLPVIIRIIEKGENLILSVNIPEEYKEIYAGEDVLGEVSIYNNLSEVVNGRLIYSIRNKSQDIVQVYDEDVVLNLGNNSFAHMFSTSPSLDSGYYFYYANFSYNGKDYTDASSFKIDGRLEKPSFISSYYVLIIKILLILLLISLVIYLLVKNKKNLLAIAKKKLKDTPLDYLRLIDETVLSLKDLITESNVKYNESLIDRYGKLIRTFFYSYYSYDKSLTFEELIKSLSKQNIDHKDNTIVLIKKIGYMPYSKELIQKDQFKKILHETLDLLAFYREDVLKKIKQEQNKQKMKS